MSKQNVVTSAKSFLRFLDAADPSAQVVPVFKGWPNFDVEVEGDRYKGTLTPKLMEGFIEFHEQMMRAYAEIRYGTPVLTRLTHAEKADLEIVFKITEGCTHGKGPLDEFINRLLAALPLNKLSGNNITAILIVAVLSYAGYQAFKEWNGTHAEQARLDASQKVEDTHARLVEKLADALSRKPPEEARMLRDRATEGYRSIVQGAPDASSISIQGEHYNADELANIRAAEPHTRARQERREDLLIDMIKRNGEALSLTLRIPGEEYAFAGKIDLSSFDPERLNELFDALRDAKAIRLFHYSVVENGRVLRTNVLAVDNYSIAR
ncbi:hypothetical protein [Pseudomonas sp. RIT411]|uniref:hypothetical protein n=1 Tax=Pseudomonas sp. RIT411 TaxID=2202160 RepID=UPI000D37BB76|nr:hypothetical protein [Pseudomonas sp. RIT 411]RAU39226.1 hypothetical protein DBY63_012155 [Pseudomonas sp. RIT 411]